jgi:hypothetical protein
MYRPKGLRLYAPNEKHGMWRVVKIGMGIILVLILLKGVGLL